MKRMFFIFVATIFSLSANSQIQLIKEIDGHLRHNATLALNQVVNNPPENLVYVNDLRSSLQFLDKEFNVIKTLNPPEGYTVNSFVVSKNHFTLSGKYEFLVSKYNLETSQVEYKLINEDGQIIFDFGDYSISGIRGNLLFMSKLESIDGEYMWKTRIYKLEGSLPTDIAEQSIPIIQYSTAFPNPSNDIVNIDYSIDKADVLFLYDSAGRMVDVFNLNPNDERLSVSTSKYPSGVYIYKYANTQGKFIKQ